ncbi:hypothetical protein LZ31DRAFT_183746 [Colletotrichum somersetense]|nr:hypothetical protein LZ31DRAFT_183746 [Colletotrichum somersetense]
MTQDSTPSVIPSPQVIRKPLQATLENGPGLEKRRQGWLRPLNTDKRLSTHPNLNELAEAKLEVERLEEAVRRNGSCLAPSSDGGAGSCSQRRVRSGLMRNATCYRGPVALGIAPPPTHVSARLFKGSGGGSGGWGGDCALLLLCMRERERVAKTRTQTAVAVFLAARIAGCVCHCYGIVSRRARLLFKPQLLALRAKWLGVGDRPAGELSRLEAGRGLESRGQRRGWDWAFRFYIYSFHPFEPAYVRIGKAVRSSV